MKEVSAATANLLLTPSEPPDEGELVPMVEVILILSEPQYSLDQVGSLFKHRTIEQFRFSSTAKSLRHIAKMFTEWADLADGLAQRAELEEKASEPPVSTSESSKGG